MENYPEFWPGWKTVRLIGRGSFGAVYEIQRELFGELEKAALKVISIPQNDSDLEELYSDGYDAKSISTSYEAYLQNIISEYSLMRKMNGSANVVSCDDVRYVQHEDKIGWDIFIKMELLTPLSMQLPEQIPENTVIKLGADICRALCNCAQYRIVHRDIKPQNIFVSPYGDYKLGDFGIAKVMSKTSGGTKIGTYRYMAPEVFNNKPYNNTADIYSLGLVLYWMLNERRMPFMPLPPAVPSIGAEEESRERRFSGEKIPAPKNGSAELKAIVLKACEFDPGKRYQSPEELLYELEALMGYTHSDSRPVTSGPDDGEKSSVSEAPDFDETLSAFSVKKQLSDEATVRSFAPEKTSGTAARPKKKKTGLIIAAVLALLVIAGTLIGLLIPSPVIEWKDPAIKRAVGEAIGKPYGDITEAEAAKLEELDLSSKKISKLTDLKYLKNLKKLNLSNNQIDDIYPLEGLTKMRSLDLSGNNIHFINALSDMKKLESLNLSSNDISDLSSLRSCEQLTYLDAANNGIEFSYNFQYLEKLEYLDVSGNKLQSLSGLEKLKLLQTLLISGNSISDISPLRDLYELKDLDIQNNPIKDYSPIEYLWVWENSRVIY